MGVNKIYYGTNEVYSFLHNEIETDTTIIYESGYNKGYDSGYVNGTEIGYNSGYTQGTQDGYVDGMTDQKNKLTSVIIDENGKYVSEDGYSSVIVDIDTDAYKEEGFNRGKQVGIAEGYETGKEDGINIGYSSGVTDTKANMQSITITKNGPYSDERGYKQVIVNVEENPNADYDDGYTDGFSNGYASGSTDGYTNGYSSGVTEGYNGIVSKTKTLNVTQNGNYTATNDEYFREVNVNVESSSTFVVTLTQDEYNSLTVKDNNVIYLIKG
jgi:flagellar biosynthesis/type III secretory pathway protein FliH